MLISPLKHQEESMTQVIIHFLVISKVDFCDSLPSWCSCMSH